MARRARVDAELVRRGLARSRQQAAELIGAGRVSIDGMPAAKPATAIAVSAALTVENADERGWVSRGAHKLIGALDTFGLGGRRPAVSGRRSVDRWVHRGPARSRRPRGRRRRRRATASWHGRCATIHASTSRTDQRARTDGRRHRRPGRPGGRRPVVHLTVHSAAGTDVVCGRRRRYRSHGEAAIRGRQGSRGRRRRRRRSAVARRRGAHRRPPRRRTAVAHGRRHRQPAARPVRQCRVLPAAAVAHRPARCKGSRSNEAVRQAVAEGPQ